MKKRRKRRKSSSASAGDKKNEMTFELFFVKCVREGKLNFWQRGEVEAFFKTKRLRPKEDLKVYEEALKAF